MLSSKTLTKTTPMYRWKRAHLSTRLRNHHDRHHLRLLPSSSLSVPPHSVSSSSFSCGTNLSSSVGTTPSTLTQWNLNQRHMLALNAVACVAALSASWLFFSAIPALLAFKKAAESMEKLLDATREELPNTMAAIRLTGMEISDLTMELSDLGEEITEGVRNSTKAVRIAEERLRHLTSMTTTGKNYDDAQQNNTHGS